MKRKAAASSLDSAAGGVQGPLWRLTHIDPDPNVTKGFDGAWNAGCVTLAHVMSGPWKQAFIATHSGDIDVSGNSASVCVNQLSSERILYLCFPWVLLQFILDAVPRNGLKRSLTLIHGNHKSLMDASKQSIEQGANRRSLGLDVEVRCIIAS